MNKYIFGCLFLLASGFLYANEKDWPKPHPGSAMNLLAFDKQQEMFDMKEKAKEAKTDPGVLSKALKLLGYTTSKSQEKFALQIKSDSGLDQDPDYKELTVDAFNFLLYEDRSRNLLVLSASEDLTNTGYYYYFYRKNGENYDLLTPKPVDIDAKYCRSFPEQYSFEGKDYVSLVSNSGGSGVLECYGNLYEVDGNTIHNVLHYAFYDEIDPSAAFFYQNSTSGPITIFSRGSLKTFQKPLTISFGLDEGGELFKKTYTLNYDWNSSRQTFVLNPVSSEVPFKFKKEVDLYGPLPEEVFKRYYDDLAHIAQSGSAGQKQALRNFIKNFYMDNLNDSKELKSLKRLLKINTENGTQ